MTRHKRASLLLPTLLASLLLPLNALAAEAEASAATQTPQAPVSVSPEHMLSARITWAPINMVAIDADYEPSSALLPLNIGLGVAYLYGEGKAHIGAAVEYTFTNFEDVTDIHGLSVPLIIMVEHKASADTAMGFTFSAGFHASWSKILAKCGDCAHPYEPSYGIMLEPFLYYSPSPGIAIGGGLNLALTTEGPGQNQFRFALPLRLSLRKQW